MSVSVGDVCPMLPSTVPVHLPDIGGVRNAAFKNKKAAILCGVAARIFPLIVSKTPSSNPPGYSYYYARYQ